MTTMDISFEFKWIQTNLLTNFLFSGWIKSINGFDGYEFNRSNCAPKPYHYLTTTKLKQLEIL